MQKQSTPSPGLRERIGDYCERVLGMYHDIPPYGTKWLGSFTDLYIERLVTETSRAIPIGEQSILTELQRQSPGKFILRGGFGYGKSVSLIRYARELARMFLDHPPEMDKAEEEWRIPIRIEFGATELTPLDELVHRTVAGVGSALSFPDAQSLARGGRIALLLDRTHPLSSAQTDTIHDYLNEAFVSTNTDWHDCSVLVAAKLWEADRLAGFVGQDRDNIKTLEPYDAPERFVQAYFSRLPMKSRLEQMLVHKVTKPPRFETDDLTRIPFFLTMLCQRNEELWDNGTRTLYWALTEFYLIDEALGNVLRRNLQAVDDALMEMRIRRCREAAGYLFWQLLTHPVAAKRETVECLLDAYSSENEQTAETEQVIDDLRRIGLLRIEGDGLYATCSIPQPHFATYLAGEHLSKMDLSQVNAEFELRHGKPVFKRTLDYAASHLAAKSTPFNFDGCSEILRWYLATALRLRGNEEAGEAFRAELVGTAKDYSRPITTYDHAIALMEKTNEPFGLAPETGDLLASMYKNRGVARQRNGDPWRAIEDLNHAVELRRSFVAAMKSAGLLTPRMRNERAIAYVNRGVVRDVLGDSKRALADYDRAIRQMNALRRTLESDGQWTPEYRNALARALVDRGVARQWYGKASRDAEERDREFAHAINDFSESIKMIESMAPAERHAAQWSSSLKEALAVAYSNRGAVRVLVAKALDDSVESDRLRSAVLDDEGQAIQLFQSLRLTEESLGEWTPEKSMALARAHLHRADAYETLDLTRAIQDTLSAIRIFTRAERILERRSPDTAEVRQELAMSYRNLGEYREVSGDSAGALQNYGKAIAIREDLLGKYAREDHRWIGVCQSLASTYRARCRLARKTGDPHAARTDAARARELRRLYRS